MATLIFLTAVHFPNVCSDFLLLPYLHLQAQFEHIFGAIQVVADHILAPPLPLVIIWPTPPLLPK